jgi:hypothetical protein
VSVRSSFPWPSTWPGAFERECFARVRVRTVPSDAPEAKAADMASGHRAKGFDLLLRGHQLRYARPMRRLLLLATLLAAPVLASDPIDAQLDAIASVHGDAGPWAAAGYRMARYAMTKLGVTAGKGDLIVAHHSPKAVQFSCVADGAQAATKVSVGKLSLSWSEATLDKMETVFTRPSTGASIALRPSKRFIERFLNAPREKARANARLVLTLPDADVFEEVPAAVRRSP